MNVLAFLILIISEKHRIFTSILTTGKTDCTIVLPVYVLNHADNL
jgi:hypothetical protein